MEPLDLTTRAADYRRIEEAIEFIGENVSNQPSLDEIADSVCLSKFHFSRMFRRWAGISPGRFLQFLTLEQTKQRLAESQSLLESSLEAGLSGPGRLHDLFVTLEAMTPGQFKKMGAGLRIEYGFGPTPFGQCLLALTERGICHLGFVAGEDRAGALESLYPAWPEAEFRENRDRVGPLIAEIFTPGRASEDQPFHLLLKGTNFQVNVWRGLLAIPPGNLVSYQDLAGLIGRPQAHRAVASAVALNPVAYLIPCHRVIAKNGRVHRYRWGAARKKAMVGWEAGLG